MTDTPNGTPDARVPNGTATAARPSGLTNAVSRPSSRLGPKGSASASANVGTRATVGSRSASTAAPGRRRLRASLGEVRERAEHLAAGVLAGAAHDLGHRRVHGVGMRGGERAEGGMPLGHERAAVQQRRRRADTGPRRPRRWCTRAHARGRRASLELLRARRRRRTSRGRRTRRRARRRAAPRSRDRRARRAPVAASADRRGEHRHAVVRRHRRDHAVRRQHARGRLQPDDAAQRRGHPPRARGVGAERERHLAGRDRDRRARARAAGDELGDRAGCGTAPYCGDRVPTRPVANWSRLVLPA